MTNPAATPNRRGNQTVFTRRTEGGEDVRIMSTARTGDAAGTVRTVRTVHTLEQTTFEELVKLLGFQEAALAMVRHFPSTSFPLGDLSAREARARTERFREESMMLGFREHRPRGENPQS